MRVLIVEDDKALADGLLRTLKHSGYAVDHAPTGELTLSYQPNYLDILPLYIALLTAFPLVYLAVRVSPLASLVLSVSLWQGAVHWGLNLPNTGSAGWFFNPFAWQVTFTLGVVIGRAAQIGIRVPRLYLLDAAALLFIAFALFVKLSSGDPFGIPALSDWIDMQQLGSDKTNLAFARFGHVLALTWLAIRYLPSGPAMLAMPGGRLLSDMGRHSLEVFCVGIVLSVLGQVVLAESAFDPAVQLLVCAVGITLLAGLGKFLSWYHTATLRRAPAMPSATLAAPLSPRP